MANRSDRSDPHRHSVGAASSDVPNVRMRGVSAMREVVRVLVDGRRVVLEEMKSAGQQVSYMAMDLSLTTPVSAMAGVSGGISAPLQGGLDYHLHAMAAESGSRRSGRAGGGTSRGGGSINTAGGATEQTMDDQSRRKRSPARSASQSKDKSATGGGSRASGGSSRVVAGGRPRHTAISKRAQATASKENAPKRATVARGGAVAQGKRATGQDRPSDAPQSVARMSENPLRKQQDMDSMQQPKPIQSPAASKPVKPTAMPVKPASKLAKPVPKSVKPVAAASAQPATKKVRKGMPPPMIRPKKPTPAPKPVAKARPLSPAQGAPVAQRPGIKVSVKSSASQASVKVSSRDAAPATTSKPVAGKPKVTKPVSRDAAPATTSKPVAGKPKVTKPKVTKPANRKPQVSKQANGSNRNGNGVTKKVSSKAALKPSPKLMTKTGAKALSKEAVPSTPPNSPTPVQEEEAPQLDAQDRKVVLDHIKGQGAHLEAPHLLSNPFTADAVPDSQEPAAHATAAEFSNLMERYEQSAPPATPKPANLKEGAQGSDTDASRVQDPISSSSQAKIFRKPVNPLGKTYGVVTHRSAMHGASAPGAEIDKALLEQERRAQQISRSNTEQNSGIITRRESYMRVPPTYLEGHETRVQVRSRPVPSPSQRVSPTVWQSRQEDEPPQQATRVEPSEEQSAEPPAKSGKKVYRRPYRGLKDSPFNGVGVGPDGVMPDAQKQQFSNLVDKALPKAAKAKLRAEQPEAAGEVSAPEPEEIPMPVEASAPAKVEAPEQSKPDAPEADQNAVETEDVRLETSSQYIWKSPPRPPEAPVAPAAKSPSATDAEKAVPFTPPVVIKVGELEPPAATEQSEPTPGPVLLDVEDLAIEPLQEVDQHHAHPFVQPNVNDVAEPDILEPKASEPEASKPITPPAPEAPPVIKSAPPASQSEPKSKPGEAKPEPEVLPEQPETIYIGGELDEMPDLGLHPKSVTMEEGFLTGSAPSLDPSEMFTASQQGQALDSVATDGVASASGGEKGGLAVPVEDLGAGLANTLGDMVGGVVQLAKRGATALEGFTPQALATDGVPSSAPLVTRMANRVAVGVQEIFTGVGLVIRGGSNVVVGSVGCVVGSATMITSTLIKKGQEVDTSQDATPANVRV
ncbi:MAG: hypothetical protein HQL53_02005 [Magnetococcales bacterium]|nr:hypothetical protein [Magnetococcales bacterium]